MKDYYTVYTITLQYNNILHITSIVISISSSLSPSPFSLLSMYTNFETDFPDTASSALTRSNSSKQCTIQFNTRGTLLAVGCSDGCVAIYDFQTRAVAKVLKGHQKPVIALR